MRSPSQRYATLLAILLEAKATLIDQALDLHDRMIGGLFNRAKRRQAEEFQQSGEAMHKRVRLLSASVKLCYKPDKVGSILSRYRGYPMGSVVQSVTEAQRLAQGCPESIDAG